MRILFLHDGQSDPSTRFRIHPWIPLLEEEGIGCEERPRREWRYRPASAKSIQRVKGYVSVFETILDVTRCVRYDAVFAQRFLFPHRLAFLDGLLRLSRRLIVDVQDALFCSPDDDRPRFAARLRRLCTMADCVLVSNQFMAEWVGMPEKTLVMPSVVDCDGIPERHGPASKEKVVIGWTGQAYQLHFLRPLFGVLKDLVKRRNVEVLYHTSTLEATTELREIGVRIIPFDPRQEIQVLQSIDIGLMPMPRTTWNLGKCPIKVIQYMAAGCAVVCSPVGSNLEMIEDGVQGYFAETPPEWHDRLTALIESPATRAAMGRAGRRRAEERYSVKANWPRFRDVMVSLLSSKS